MKHLPFVALLILSLWLAEASGDEYSDTQKMFEDAGLSQFFQTAHGYALFPIIGKAGYFVGGGYGEGRVFANREYIGDSTMFQGTLGFQLGAAGYRQVIFFQNEAALQRFTSGNFAFSAGAQAVVLTAAAGAAATTSGSSATASGGMNNAITTGQYHNGMATFAITIGGLMYEASIGGQKFSYKPLPASEPLPAVNQ